VISVGFWVDTVLMKEASSARAVLRALAGPLDEPAQGQGCLGRVAEPFGDRGCPHGQYRGAVDADRLGWVHRRAAYASAKRKPTECPAARSAPQCSLSFSTLYPSCMGDVGEPGGLGARPTSSPVCLPPYSPR